MSEQNKAVIQGWIEMWNTGNVEIADEIFDPEWVNHASWGESEGIASVKENVNRTRTAFPDLQMEIGGMMAADDRVAVHMKMTGTHDGEYLGVPASGKKVTLEAFAVRRIAGGKIVEGWTVGDLLGMLTQMGATTIPEQLR